MKIVKQGDVKDTWYCTCSACGCQFEAQDSDGIAIKRNAMYDETATRCLVIKCPQEKCGEWHIFDDYSLRKPNFWKSENKETVGDK